MPLCLSLKVGTVHPFGQLHFPQMGISSLNETVPRFGGSIFYSMLGAPQDFRKEPTFQFSPNLLVAQRSGRGPSKAGWKDGNPAASNTSQAGLTTALWVGGRQAAGLAAPGGPRERGEEFASSSVWVCRSEGECLVPGSLDPVCLESGWVRALQRQPCGPFPWLVIHKCIQVLLSNGASTGKPCKAWH